MYALAVEGGITLGRPEKKKGNIKNNFCKHFNNLLLQSTNCRDLREIVTRFFQNLT